MSRVKRISQRSLEDYLGCVSVGEEVAVDLFELFNAQVSARAVLQEAFVPFLDLGICIRKENEKEFNLSAGKRAQSEK